MRLDDAVAAVNTELSSRHELGGVAGEEDDGTLQVLWVTHLRR